MNSRGPVDRYKYTVTILEDIPLKRHSLFVICALALLAVFALGSTVLAEQTSATKSESKDSAKKAELSCAAACAKPCVDKAAPAKDKAACNTACPNGGACTGQCTDACKATCAVKCADKAACPKHTGSADKPASCANKANPSKSCPMKPASPAPKK